MWSGEAVSSPRMDPLWGSSWAMQRCCRDPEPAWLPWHVVLACPHPDSALPLCLSCPASRESWSLLCQSRAVVAGRASPAERMEQKCLIRTSNTHLSPALGDRDPGDRALSPLTLSLTQLFAFSQRFKSSGSSRSDESGFT